MQEKIKAIISGSIAVKRKVLEDEKLLRTIEQVATLMVHALKNDHRIYFCGNGERGRRPTPCR